MGVIESLGVKAAAARIVAKALGIPAPEAALHIACGTPEAVRALMLEGLVL